jgi:hypothetical protein
MKTAVEWLLQQMDLETISKYDKQLLKAKEMEKEQISKAFFEGRLKEIGSGVLFDLQPLIDTYYDYYNETFKTE